MNFIVVEAIFSILNIVTYLIFWKELSFQMSVLMYTSVVITILRLIYGKQNPKEVIESRKAMMYWFAMHLTVVLIIFISGWDDIGLILIAGFGGGAFLWVLYWGFMILILEFEGDVKKSKVSRLMAYSMTFETFALLIVHMYNGVTVIKAALTIISIVAALVMVERNKEVKDNNYKFEFKR